MFFDPLYIGLVVVTLLISGAAQLYIRSTYGRWSKVANGARLSGAQIAEFLRERATFGDRPGRDAITDIKIVPGNLSDHFDPRDRSLGLSPAVAEQPSIASMAIAAHEVGHAVQHAEGSALMKIRGVLVPAASLGPNLGYLLIIGGLIFQVMGLVTLGIILFGVAVVFSLLTLPVEIDASRKALAMLDFDRTGHHARGTPRGPVDADGGSPDVRRGGGHRGPDAGLLPDPGSTEQLTGP